MHIQKIWPQSLPPPLSTALPPFPERRRNNADLIFLYTVVRDFVNVPELLCDVHTRASHATSLESCFYACQPLTTMNPISRIRELYNNNSAPLDICRGHLTQFLTSVKNIPYVLCPCGRISFSFYVDFWKCVLAIIFNCKRLSFLFYFVACTASVLLYLLLFGYSSIKAQQGCFSTP